MKKALRIIGDDAELKRLDDDFNALEESLHQREQFIEKQIDDIQKERKEKLEKITDEIENYARASGLISEAFKKDKKCHLHIENGVLFLCEDEHNPGNFFKDILGL